MFEIHISPPKKLVHTASFLNVTRTHQDQVVQRREIFCWGCLRRVHKRLQKRCSKAEKEIITRKYEYACEASVFT